MSKSVYKMVLEFKERHPWTIGWRLRQNSKVVELHLNPDEKVIYAFIAQKNDNPFNIFGSAVVALTNKRILIGRKRVVVGYFLNSITPDMYNDLKVSSGILWGKVYIDTIKEFVTLSNISKGNFDDSKFKSAKETIISAIKASEDTPMGIITNYYAMTLVGSKSVEERIANINKVSREDIINISKKINMHTIFILEDNDEKCI